MAALLSHDRRELRSQSGSNEEGSATTSAVLDRGPEVARQEAAHGGRESPAKGETLLGLPCRASCRCAHSKPATRCSLVRDAVADEGNAHIWGLATFGPHAVLWPGIASLVVCHGHQLVLCALGVRGSLQVSGVEHEFIGALSFCLWRAEAVATCSVLTRSQRMSPDSIVGPSLVEFLPQARLTCTW